MCAYMYMQKRAPCVYARIYVHCVVALDMDDSRLLEGGRGGLPLERSKVRPAFDLFRGLGNPGPAPASDAKAPRFAGNVHYDF